MKKVILTMLISVLGALLIGGGAAFAAYMNYANTVSFEKYDSDTVIVVGGRTPSEMDELRAQKRIQYPNFSDARKSMIMPELVECYAEVDDAGHEYALLIAQKYDNNADLDFTVETTDTRVTIKFTGTGYPENGEPEDLSRTYIFDIEGAGANKLPKLLNRADFIGY